MMPETGLAAGQLTCELCHTRQRVLPSAKRLQLKVNAVDAHACCVAAPVASCVSARTSTNVRKTLHCLALQARDPTDNRRLCNLALVPQPRRLPLSWSAPLVAPPQAFARSTSLLPGERRDAAASSPAASHRRDAAGLPSRVPACAPAKCDCSRQLRCAGRAVGGLSADSALRKGHGRHHLLAIAARSGSTAENTGQSNPSSGAMNGKQQHSFLSGYDDAWDTGSNGVGGHPPVALITTLGCPHCKRVRTHVSPHGNVCAAICRGVVSSCYIRGTFWYNTANQTS